MSDVDTANATRDEAKRHLRIMQRLANEQRWRRMLLIEKPPEMLADSYEYLLVAGVQLDDRASLQSVIKAAIAARLPQEWYLQIAFDLVSLKRTAEARLLSPGITNPDVRRRFDEILRPR